MNEKRYLNSLLSAVMLIAVFFLSCGREKLSERLVGAWENKGRELMIEFDDKGEFVASLYGPCPPVIHAEGFQQGIKIDIVKGTFSCTPEYTPMEKDSSGHYYPGRPVGKLKMTGLYRIKQPMLIEGFYRVKVAEGVSDLVVFQASYHADTLTLHSKGISISGGTFRRKGVERPR